MFCEKCGNQLPEGAKFCSKCGAPVFVTRETTPAENIPQEPNSASKDFASAEENSAQSSGYQEEKNVQEEQPAGEPMYGQTETPPAGNGFPPEAPPPYGAQGAAFAPYPPTPARRGKVWIAVIAALVVIAVLGVAIKSVYFRSSPEQPLDYLVQAVNKNDSKYLIKMYPKQVQSVLKTDQARRTLDAGLDELKEELENEVGRNAKLSYEIDEKRKMDPDELTRYNTYVAQALASVAALGTGERSALGDLTIEDAYTLDVELTLKGADGRETEDTTIVVYQIDGDWYMIQNFLY